MKIAALVSVVAAGRQARDAGQSLFNKMLGDHNNNVEQRNFVFSETDSLYQIFQFYMGNSGQDFSLVDSMLSYGCWCQIRNQETQGIVAGHGAPVDALDAACKAWHQCRTCTTVDFSAESTCNPNEVAYEVGFDPTTGRIDCQFNPDDCSTQNCGCDEQLAHTLTDLASVIDENFLTHTDGSGFSPTNECHAPVTTPSPDNGNGNGGNGGDGTEDPTNPGGNGGGNGNGNGGNGGADDGAGEEPVEEQLQCCGTYPNRFEFLPHGGTRACCAEVTYNTNKHECCAGGFLGAIGTCAAARRR